jgi:hypothetical protein
MATWADITGAWAEQRAAWDAAALRSRSVLPPNASAQERTLEDVAWRLTDPPDIAEVTDPSAIPASLLPWLAWAMSVDVWTSAETEAVKRNSVATSIELHRLKGTVEGFRRLSRLFGAELAGVKRPPNKTFCGKSYTRAEKDARLAVLPQIRIRTKPQQGQRAPGAVFLCRNYTTGFLVTSDAAARMAPQAYYYDQGIETQVATFQESLTSGGALQVRVGAIRKHATFCGGFMRYTSDCGAAKRIYSFSIATAYGSSVRWKTLIAGLAPLSVYPELTYEQSTRKGLFTPARRGGAFVGQYLVRSNAEQRVYQRIYLFDPSRTLEAFGKSSYLGAMRLGMPAYTAELQVVFPGQRPRRAAGRFVCGFTTKSDHSLFDRYITALAWSKAARDKVLLDTYSYQPLTAGEEHIAGTGLIAGQLVKRF